MNGRSPVGWSTLGQQGFPVITVPAGFTTEVWDRRLEGDVLNVIGPIAEVAEMVEGVAQRVLAAGLRRGRAVHRRYRWGRTTVWYPRWCDGHVALGLVDAAAIAATGSPGAIHSPRAARDRS